jgi:hypothetical protein
MEGSDYFDDNTPAKDDFVPGSYPKASELPPEMLTTQRRTYVQNDLPLKLQHTLRECIVDLGRATTYNHLREVGTRLAHFGVELQDLANDWETL